MVTWLPIETAPKDGTNLLLGWTTFTEPDIGHFDNDKDEWRASADDAYIRPPTHWMPLPEPPTT